MYGDDTLERKKNLTFPLAHPLNANDIANIPWHEWKRLVEQTKDIINGTGRNMVLQHINIRNAMFQSQAMPITRVEYHVYMDALQRSLGVAQHHVLSALRSGARKIGIERDGFDMQHLEQMEQRIKTLKLQDADTTAELMWIQNKIVDLQRRFPIAEVLTEQDEILKISVEDWNRLAEKTKDMKDANEIIDAMFSARAKPITTTEYGRYWIAIGELEAPTNNMSHIVEALHKLNDSIIRRRNKVCRSKQEMEFLKQMEARIGMLKIEGSGAMRELRMIQNTRQRCLNKDNQEHHPRKELTFPIAYPLNDKEIASISPSEWMRLVQATKHMTHTTDIRRAMFANETPITLVEFDSYLDAVLLALGFNAARRIYDNLLRWHDMIAARQNESVLKDLQKMEQRLSALNMDDRDATDELKWLQDKITTLQKTSDQESKTNITFPIAKVLTGQEIASISFEQWTGLAEKTQDMKETSAIIDAMFYPRAIPITTIEYSRYLKAIRQLESPTYDMSHIDEVLNKLNDAIIRQRNQKCHSEEDIADLKQMEARLRMLKIDNSGSRHELRMIQTAIHRCQEHGDNKEYQEQQTKELTFPIAYPLNYKEIASISPSEWMRFVQVTKHMTRTSDIRHAMFETKATPITLVEFIAYRDALVLALGFSGVGHIYDALSKWHDMIAERQNKSVLEDLQRMEQRLSALNMDDDTNATNELTWLRESIADLQPSDEISKIDSREATMFLPNTSPDDDDATTTDEDEVSQKTTRETLEPKAHTENSDNDSTEDEEIVPQQRQPYLGGSSAPATSIDTSKPLLPAAPLRKLFDAYLRHVGHQQSDKRFPVSPEFLNMFNRRMYEWVSDVMSLLSVTSQSDDGDCQSTDITAPAVLEALKLTNHDMELSNNSAFSNLATLVPNVSIPKPRKTLLVKAMLYYAHPRRRITIAAYRVMETAVSARLCYFVESMSTLTMTKHAIKLGVCPAFSTLGRVSK